MTLPQMVNPVHEDAPVRRVARRFSPSGRIGGYIVGLVTVGIATGLDVGLWDIIHPQASPLYIGAIMVTGWLGGLGPGLFATALAGVALVFLFVDPVYSFRIAPHDMLRLSVFLAVALLISWLNARRKDAEQAVEAARAGLEIKVAERTVDLEKINVELREQQQQLRNLSWQLSQTEEQERRRIATSLHDGLAQLLAVASIKIDAMLKSASPPAEGEMNDVRGLLDQALTQTRSLTIDLSPPVLYELGLKAAIEWLALEMEQRYRLKVEVVCGTVPSIDQVTRSVLFHSIRELLINVAKHAGASSARVVVTCGAGQLDALVEDNGVGFDSGAALTRASERGGFGLFNVRERIHHLGGVFQISAKERHGTRVHLTAPMQRLDAGTN